MFLKESNLNNLLNTIEVFFFIYIIMQPFLDMAAYFGVPISQFIRVLVIGIGIIYFLLYPQGKLKKFVLVYLGLLAFFFLLNTVNNYFVKDPYRLIQELTYGIKSFYVIEMLLVYLAVFLRVKERIHWEKKVQRNITINLIIIGIVMLVATVTDSGMLSYAPGGKEGHSGWFYSANDVSAVLAMGFGIMVLFVVENKSAVHKLLLFPCILLVLWSMLTIGTKVGLGAALIILFSGLTFLIVTLFIKKRNWVNIGILSLSIASLSAYLPYSAIGENMDISPYFQSFSDSENSSKETKPEQDTRKGKGEDTDNSDGQGNDEVEKDINDIRDKISSGEVLSGRDEFLAEAKSDWSDAPISQKLLGMGPGANYKDGLKIIEMDFWDWVFGYGIIGSLLLFTPFIYILSSIVINVVKFRLKQVNVKMLLLGVIITLGLGISFFAGHILMSPTSGIYFSIILSYLYIITVNHKNYRQQNKL